jgi:CheY-like chemotaxis protein
MMQSIPSVLVIDDDSEALNTFTQLLRALGVKNICRLGDAESALEVLEHQPFTMILCDYRLAGMDGTEFVERLRARGDETPVVMLSGVPDKAAVLRATTYTNVDFIGKPFRILDLVNSMEQLAEAA